MNKLKPVADRIIVRQLEEDESTGDHMVGLIAIPDTVAQGIQGKTLQAGEVMAIGDGVRTAMGDIIPCRFEVGHIVYWQANYSQMIPIEYANDEAEYFMTKEDQIVALEV